MPKFTDGENREWIVAVNVDAIKRVRNLVDDNSKPVDLLDAMDGQIFERLVTRPDLLCDVVFAICKPQADAAGVTAESFGKAMAGDVIDTATTAFLEALVDFFPGQRRAILRTALDKIKKFEGLALARAEAVLHSPELDRMLQREIDKMKPPEPAEGPTPGN